MPQLHAVWAGHFSGGSSDKVYALALVEEDNGQGVLVGCWGRRRDAPWPPRPVAPPPPPVPVWPVVLVTTSSVRFADTGTLYTWRHFQLSEYSKKEARGQSWAIAGKVYYFQGVSSDPADWGWAARTGKV